MICLTAGGHSGSHQAPVFEQVGVAERTVVAMLGHGGAIAGHFGTVVGTNAYELIDRRSFMPFLTKASLSPAAQNRDGKTRQESPAPVTVQREPSEHHRQIILEGGKD
ncbi:MAG: hypothetical protein NTX50_06745 [Candidatus Sumerlaeota bacterium]|nr:hypothetical protein [Candidatus Sumerlaeota bacterium]